MLERETWQRPRNYWRNHYKKPGAKCRNLKEVKSKSVLEREEKTAEKTKRQCRKYLLVSVCGWLQKACHITQFELLQKCIKYAKIYLDSFLTVTTVLENWMLVQTTRRVYIQNIPDKRNKNILILPNVLNLQINM